MGHLCGRVARWPSDPACGSPGFQWTITMSLLCFLRDVPLCGTRLTGFMQSWFGFSSKSASFPV
eukprot:3245988-Lingulodinium_polyedra.AAC.1